MLKNSWKRSNHAGSPPPPGPDPEDEEATALDADPEAINASQLIGLSSGVSLDGRSLILPDQGPGDDVSSIHNSLYDFRQAATPAEGATDTMRILGTMDHDDELPPGISASSSGRKYLEAQQHGDYEYREGAYADASLKHGESGEEDDGGCLPLWITEAPAWLKMIIVLSTALLIGAIVLIGVGAALAVREDESSSVSRDPTFTLPPAPVPTPAPVVQSEKPVDEGTDPGTDNPDTPAPATPKPGPNDTPAPTPTPSVSTPSPTSSSFTFYVIAGRFTEDAVLALPGQLQTLPEDTILVHLGDWNSPFATSCVEETYQDNVELYQNSKAPVYFVPGDNEFNGMLLQ